MLYWLVCDFKNTKKVCCLCLQDKCVYLCFGGCQSLQSIEENKRKHGFYSNIYTKTSYGANIKAVQPDQFGIIRGGLRFVQMFLCDDVNHSVEAYFFKL